MDYLPSSLEKLLSGYPQGLPLEQALQITRELLTALEGLHNLLYKPVHRDLKPSNILLHERGGTHLADLGVGQSSRNMGRRGCWPCATWDHRTTRRRNSSSLTRS